MKAVTAVVGDLHVAEDLVAEAFARAWTSWGKVRGHPAPEWHQDGGRQNREIETTPRPRLSVKLAYWLSDVYR